MKIDKIMGAHCLDVTSIDSAKEYIEALVEQRKGGYSVAINAEKIMMCQKNKEMRNIIENSVLPTPDGAGAVLAFKWLLRKKVIKLDLPRAILELSNKNRYKLFILGSSEKINSIGVEKIKEKYPNILIVGFQHGYFESKSQLIDTLKETNPDIVIVAMGSPRQEILSKELLNDIPSSLFIGSGGALDILAGNIKRAPRFFIDNNLEWCYRLMSQPSRIKRQKVLPLFLMKLFIMRLRGK